MPRLTLFAKGNSDLTESLFLCRDEQSTWNGLGEALRASRPDWKVRFRHETLVRSDMLLAATGVVPEALLSPVVGHPYTIESQFSTAFYEPADVHVLSIQADITNRPLRHRASGALFSAGVPQDGSPELRRWVRAECEPLPLMTPEESMAAIEGVVARLRSRSQAPVLIYNLSSVVPGETDDNSATDTDRLSTRIKRFNLALIDLARRCDVSIVDVERVAARAGTDRVKLDATRLNGAGNRLVAQHVLTILDRHGCFAELRS